MTVDTVQTSHTSTSSTTSTRRQWRRPALLWAAPPLVLLAALAAAEWAAWPFLRAPLQRLLSQQLQRTVELQAPFGVRLLGTPRLHTAGLVIGSPSTAFSPASSPASSPGSSRASSPAAAPAATPASTAPPPTPQPDLLRASAVQLSMPWATLWQLARGAGGEPLVVNTLSVDHLQAHLLRDAEQRANWRLQPTSAAPANDPPTAPQPLPRFGQLLLRSGDIVVEDVPLQLRLQARVRTQEGPAPASGSSQPGATSPASGLDVQARGEPLAAHLQSSGVLPLTRSGDSTATSAPVRLDLRVGRAHLLLEGSASDALSLGGLDAAFELSGPSLAAVGDAVGLTLPTTAAFDMRGRINKSDAVWSANVAMWRVGASRLRGDFRYDTGRTPSLLTGNLGGERLVLADLGPAIGAPAETAASPASGRVLPQRVFDIPSLQRMDADVTLRLAQLDLGTTQLESLAPLQGRVRLQSGVLSVQELLARTAGGTLRGEFSVDARTPATPRWRTDLRVTGITLDQFVKARNSLAAPAAKAPAGPVSTTGKTTASTRAASTTTTTTATTTARATPRPSGYIQGALGGALKATGSGRSIAAVMATLDGTAGLWVRDGSVSHLLVELAGIDLAESLGVLLRGDRNMPLRCAVTQWTLRGGVARPEVALIDTRDTTLLVSGEVSLAQETLGLVVTAKPHDWSLLALRSPLQIKGSFALPQLQLDKGRMALRLAGAAALGALAPAAALLALIDLGEADQQLCTEALKRAKTF